MKRRRLSLPGEDGRRGQCVTQRKVNEFIGQTMTKLRLVGLGLLILLSTGKAFPSAALFLEEPFGAFGLWNPTGHAAIYLSRVCADSPTRLRLCRPNEYGVVISRYHHIDGYDWLAIPLLPYLYAVDSMDEVPSWATPESEAGLRDAWRREHLEALVPDAAGGGTPSGEWIQLVGALYDRKIFVYEFDTSERQDKAFIRKFNSHANRSHFNLFFHNCADFSREVIDFYHPHSVRRSFSADLGMTTPKQLAKSLVHYSARDEEMGLRIFVLPQVSGTIPRSQHVDGVLEAILFKKYVLPLALLHPYVAAGVAVTYLTGGRFDPAKHSVPLDQPLIPATLRENESSPPLAGDLARVQGGSRLGQRGISPAPVSSDSGNLR
jgi:hypothetical protein